MLPLTRFLREALQGKALRWAQSACGALPAHSRGFAAAADDQGDQVVEQNTGDELEPFDAAAASSPYSVHQLIGDPRTGIADDTTTAPWGDDVAVEWVWSDQDKGVEWYRYSQGGPSVLPYMYMDSRLSDHSKNLMYMLRCKDPQRWTIPTLAEKFRVRRQRVMAILALKEIQAHRTNQGLDMQGPMAPYSFRIPLQDIHIQPDGEPVDLAQLVAQQQQQQQQQQPAAAAMAAGPVLTDNSSSGNGDPLGSLDEFLAVDSHSNSAGLVEQQSLNALISLAAAAGGQAADLASLMPQIATVTQQLQLQLLQLLQRHHYSIDELQHHLLQQIDQAEAYYNAHIAGTALEQLLALPSRESKKPAGDDAAAEEQGAGATAADSCTKPLWLDFHHQRQQVRDLLQALSPVLQFAGAAHDIEVSRLLVQLKKKLQELAAAGSSDSSAHAGLAELIKSAEQSGLLSSAFHQLDTAKRQQLLQLLPEVKISLNVQGADLKEAVERGTESAVSDSSSSSGSTAAAGEFKAPDPWPGSVPAVVDVWNYEEVPRKHRTALQQQLTPMKQLLDTVANAVASTKGSSKGTLAEQELLAVQQATQVYSGLVYEYDQILAQQAADLVSSSEAPNLPPQAQRRMMRILRELDMNALEKLLLWETVYKESAEADSGRASRARLRRLVKRVTAAINSINQQAVAAGQPHPFADYPDLAAAVPSHDRVNADMALAHLDAVVVGRQFHRGSGDRHFKMIDSYPAFEGYSLQEFDRIEEGELSAVTRLASEREDNMMWKEFRDKLLKNLGLTAPDLHQHLYNARPPKPRQGWSYVVHPVGAEARARHRWELEQSRRNQYLDVDQTSSWYEGVEPGQLGAVEGFDPALNPKAPAEPYVAMPGRKFRGLNEEETVVVGYSRAKPRRKWSKR